MATKFNDIMGYNFIYMTGFRDLASCCQSKSATADRDRHGNEIWLIWPKIV